MNASWISVKNTRNEQFDAYLSLPPTGRGQGLSFFKRFLALTNTFGPLRINTQQMATVSSRPISSGGKAEKLNWPTIPKALSAAWAF